MLDAIVIYWQNVILHMCSLALCVEETQPSTENQHRGRMNASYQEGPEGRQVVFFFWLQYTDSATLQILLSRD